jgi:hypothetical protein
LSLGRIRAWGGTGAKEWYAVVLTARQAQAPLVKRASVVTVTAGNNVGKSEGEGKHEAASLCL